MRIKDLTPIERAYVYFGFRQTKMAKACGVAQATVSAWLSGKHGISAASAVRIEKATNGSITRYELCPEVFGPQKGAA